MLTRQEVAERLKVSVRSVDRLRASGILRGSQVGGCVRFHEDQVAIFEASILDPERAVRLPKVKGLVIRDWLGELEAAKALKASRRRKA